MGILRPGDEMIYCTGGPYDTLEEVIGLRGEGKGSLKEYGISYKQMCIRDRYESAEKLSQTLMLPLQFHVAAYVAQTEEDWIDKIRSMGYGIEDFGNRTYIVREIPAFMELEEAESFLNDLFQELEDRPDLTNQKVLDRIIMRSCKSAVKGGDHLESAEIDALIRDLKNCVNPFSCPHGRPTFILSLIHI